MAASLDSKRFLKSYAQNKFVTKTQLTEDYHLVLDNIWNIPTAPRDNKQKMRILYTLVEIFSSTENKKNSHYALFNGPNAGIYITWKEIVPKIKYIEQNPKYGKGYNNLDTTKKVIEKILGKGYILSNSINQLENIVSGNLIKGETS